MYSEEVESVQYPLLCHPAQSSSSKHAVGLTIGGATVVVVVEAVVVVTGITGPLHVPQLLGQFSVIQVTHSPSVHMFSPFQYSQSSFVSLQPTGVGSGFGLGVLHLPQLFGQFVSIYAVHTAFTLQYPWPIQ